MKPRAYKVAGGCLLFMAAVLLFISPPKITKSQPSITKYPDKSTEDDRRISKESVNNNILIRGVGNLKYRTNLLNHKPVDLIRIVAAKLPSKLPPVEEYIEQRTIENEWPKTDLYFGKNDQILHISLNKGKFQTYPLDDNAVAELQSMQGHAIVKLGYPDDLLDSGYTKEDFLTATYDRWDKYHSGNEFEYEITPVVVKITPEYKLSTSENWHLIGKEFPMILVKSGRKFYSDEGTYQTGTFTDAYKHDESIFRSWGLIPYVPIEIDGKMTLPPLGAGVSYKEPLMEAWKKRQAKSQNNR
jgi:hypothetical protein